MLEYIKAKPSTLTTTLDLWCGGKDLNGGHVIFWCGYLLYRCNSTALMFCGVHHPHTWIFACFWLLRWTIKIMCSCVSVIYWLQYILWACLVSRKWEVPFSTSVVHPNTGWKNPFPFFLFPFTQLFPHFQGATVNFVVV